MKEQINSQENTEEIEEKMQAKKKASLFSFFRYLTWFEILQLVILSIFTALKDEQSHLLHIYFNIVWFIKSI